jgi:hypothetical protein
VPERLGRELQAVPPGDVHFGGPDRAPGFLRDLLAERDAAVSSGGAIDWVTHCFRGRLRSALTIMRGLWSRWVLGLQ